MSEAGITSSSALVATSSSEAVSESNVAVLDDIPDQAAIEPFNAATNADLGELVSTVGGASTLFPVQPEMTDLALTTVFTPPAGCNDPAEQEQPASETYIDSTTSCYPQSWEWMQHWTESYYYSPGVCPAKYAWVTATIRFDRNGSYVTEALCCPSGIYSFTDHSDIGTYCYEDGPTLGAAAGTGRYAFPVSVAWKEQDLTKFQPPSAPLTAMRRDGWKLPTPSALVNATTTPPTTLAPSAPPAKKTSAALSGSGFSTGAAAGIGVGVTVAVFALIAGLWLFFRRHRRRWRSPSRRSSEDAGAVENVPVPAKAEKDGKERFEIGDNSKPTEVSGRSIAELDSGWQAPEADGDARPAGGK